MTRLKHPRFGDIYEWSMSGSRERGSRFMYLGESGKYAWAWVGIRVRGVPDYPEGAIINGLNSLIDENWVLIDE